MQHHSEFTLNIPESDKPRLIIVGGGFGGIHLLRSISKKDFQVVLLDRYNYHTFQPLLYQVATAGLEPDSVAGPLRKIMDPENDVYFRMVTVERVIPTKNEVETNAGSLKYDYLVIATGAKMNFFGNKSIAKNSFPLKQVTHALDLRSHIFQQFERLEVSRRGLKNSAPINFVVVGAGPTGVEVCGALAELKYHALRKDYPELDIRKVKIYLVEGMDRVLPAMSEKAGEKAHMYLKKMGVQVVLNTMIEEYDGQTATLNNGNKIPTKTLIWAAGVKGNVPEGFENGSIKKGKLVVNEFHQVQKGKSTNDVFKRIFAIGDVSLMKTDNYEAGLPGLAQVAIQQGKHIARNLKRMAKNRSPKKFKYKNKGVMATVGKNKAIADLPGNIKVFGFAGWLLWMVVHLLFLVGFRNKAVVFANWVWNYFTYDRGIRLILRPSPKEKDQISEKMELEMNEAKG
ncbi:NAD(P)/FAD-dependent oxidoreductase [Maribellus maritimus]|uniref:NAD(P)/FAD-dependent oxidoreductase n=1 Tax=Maribellus maritimus TaxID=2870838 RepID=UPI001EEB340C|nr:NAD(P)/FAD-dependent oxidoreductase [Maribellus maritimus]MCG6187098.1 NAD(P)/FAD-dependent oxidoreductase [Maribellus maritimus]